MFNFVTGVDIFFKIALALIAAYISYQFGAFKQQNEDIGLVAELVFADKDRTAAAGIILAAEYADLNRIPVGFFTSIVSSAYISGNASLREVAYTTANRVAQSNPEISRQLAQAFSAHAARVYFHIRREADRTKVREIEEALEMEGQSLGLQPVIVPGIEFINGQQQQTEVKCFRKEECETLAVKLVEFLKRYNIAARVNDSSKSDVNSIKVPLNQFEIWFAPIS